MIPSHALNEALSSFGPAPRRYPIVTVRDVTHYGPWRIAHEPPPIPMRNCDWHFWHDNFDGAEDSNDRRYGFAGSFAGALCEIDEMEDEA